MAGEQVIIEEDETGRVCRRYTTNFTIIPEVAIPKRMSKRLVRKLSEIFMPAGFPASVSSDYFEYQLYDSLQAFSSSIAGLLASRAVLEGVGVGVVTASPTQALLLTIAQDAVGRLATILFAWRIGSALEPEAKRYRLLADIFNDGAMILDCLSPALPGHIRVVSLCTSGSLRALCGVAAGGAKAALSVHFARANNIGDLNAKDSSQETVIGLLGMLAGSFVVSRVTSREATWALLLVLLTIHLGTNCLAVRAVVMRTLNRQRACIVYESFRSKQTVPSPHEVSKSERIFASGSSLRSKKAGRTITIGRCDIGIKLGQMFPSGHAASADILDAFLGENYVLWFLLPTPRFGTTYPNIGICLKKGAGGSDQLKAWVHAIELAHTILDKPDHKPHLELFVESLQTVNTFFPKFIRETSRTGWDIDNPALITGPSFRLSNTVAEKDVKKRV